MNVEQDGPMPESAMKVIRHHLEESDRAKAERDAATQLVRDLLVALCRKQGYEPSEDDRNYQLALRLGVGSVFELPDE